MWTQVVGKVAAGARAAREPLVARHASGDRARPHDVADAVRAAHARDRVRLHRPRLLFETSDGRRREIALEPKTVADFYREVMRTLRRAGQPSASGRCRSRSRRRSDSTGRRASFVRRGVGPSAGGSASQRRRVFKEFRGRFHRQVQPGPFLLGQLRSGGHAVQRPARARAPGADAMTREAYSHEVIERRLLARQRRAAGAGVLRLRGAGAGRVQDARAVGPAAAFYSPDFNEFHPKYEDVRTAASPRDALMEFLRPPTSGRELARLGPAGARRK